MENCELIAVDRLVDQNWTDLGSASDYSIDEDLFDFWVVPKKRKRLRKSFPGPKLLKNDIRLSYANMLVNVINCCDCNLMYGLFDTFFVPNFRQTLRKTNSGSAKSNHISCINGTANVARHWFMSFLLAPDIAISLKKISVVNCGIVATISISANRVYDEPQTLSECTSLVDREFESMQVENHSQLHISAKERIDALVASVRNMTKALPLRYLPKETSAIGKIVMCTDEEKRIISLDWSADFSTHSR